MIPFICRIGRIAPFRDFHLAGLGRLAGANSTLNVPRSLTRGVCFSQGQITRQRASVVALVTTPALLLGSAVRVLRQRLFKPPPSPVKRRTRSIGARPPVGVEF